MTSAYPGCSLLMPSDLTKDTAGSVPAAAAIKNIWLRNDPPNAE